DQPEEVTLGDDEVHGVVGDDAPEPLDEAHAPHELGAPAHVPDSLSGTVGAADSGLTRASPSRRNCSQKGVTRPLRAKRMVSRRTMPKTGGRLLVLADGTEEEPPARAHEQAHEQQ